jgi:hypothetical protein
MARLGFPFGAVEAAMIGANCGTVRQKSKLSKWATSEFMPKFHRRLRVQNVLVIGFLALLPWVPSSLIPSARAQVTVPKSDLEAKYDSAFQEMFADPADMDKAFAYARLAIQMRDYEGAISTLERMLLVEANLPRVRMELGVLYFRLGSFEVARGYFQEVLAAKSVPPVVTERVNSFLAKIEEQTSRHKYKATVFAGIRHQSNANAGPSTTRVRVLGLDVDLDTTFTNKPDFDNFQTIRLTHGFDLGIEPRVDIESELVLYRANQATQDQVDTSVAQMKSGPRFVVDPDIARGLDIRPYARWDFVNLADRQYYVGFGGGVDGNYALGPATRLSMDASLIQRNHNNSASNPTLTDLNGPRGTVSVSLAHALSPSLRVTIGGNIQREAAEDPGRRTWSFEASSGLTRVFTSPFPDLTGPWSIAGTVIASKTIYDEPTASIDPGITRDDDSYSGQLVGTVQLGQSMSLVTTGIYKKVRSNLPNFSYDNWSFTVGLAVQF